jgi:hypothetical protein
MATSTFWVNGDALVARLLRSAADRNVDLRTRARAIGLLRDDARVTGARVEIGGVVHEVRASRGVVLACGGFPHDIARRASTFAYTPSGKQHWSAAPRSNTGDGIRLGESIGGRFNDTLDAPAAWAPVSLVPQRGGDVAFAHLIERAKPGVIAVTRAGQRFVNEASSYHEFHVGVARDDAARCGGVCLADLRSPFPAPLRARFFEALSVFRFELRAVGLSEARRDAG